MTSLDDELWAWGLLKTRDILRGEKLMKTSESQVGASLVSTYQPSEFG